MAEFTKSPWVQCYIADTVYIDDEDGETIAMVDSTKANADLIVLVPDMYVMIEELTEMMDKLNEGFNADGKAIELSIRAEALLKKARGES